MSCVTEVAHIAFTLRCSGCMNSKWWTAGMTEIRKRIFHPLSAIKITLKKTVRYPSTAPVTKRQWLFTVGGRQPTFRTEIETFKYQWLWICYHAVWHLFNLSCLLALSLFSCHMLLQEAFAEFILPCFSERFTPDVFSMVPFVTLQNLVDVFLFSISFPRTILPGHLDR